VVAEALADGWSFGGLYATAGGSLVRTLLVAPDGGLRLETVATVDGAVPSIVDLTRAAAWDEREAHDLYGVDFAGRVHGSPELLPAQAHALKRRRHVFL
jgi:hypothetical protein